MKKRVLSFIMAVMLCLTMLPTAVWAEEAQGNDAGTNVVKVIGESLPAQPAVESADAAASAVATEDDVAEVTTADGTTQYYADLAEAIAAAAAAENSTVKLLKDVTATSMIAVNGGRFTIDLNGCTWQRRSEDKSWALEVCSGDVTVTSTNGAGALNGSIEDLGFGKYYNYNAITVQDDATVHITNGVTLNQMAVSENADVTLDAGVIITDNFFTGADSIAKHLVGKALQRYENGEPVEGEYVALNKSYSMDDTGSVIVIEHPSCAGHVDETGKCVICGNACDHSDADATQTSCPTCDAALVAELTLTDMNGGTFTKRFSTVGDAVAYEESVVRMPSGERVTTAVIKLQQGSTPTVSDRLLFDSRDRTIVLDLNGCTVKTAREIWVRSGVTIKNGSIESTAKTENESAIMVKASGNAEDAVLTLEDVTVTGGVYAIDVNAGKLIIKSGSYGDIWINQNLSTAELSGGTYQKRIMFTTSTPDYSTLLKTGYIFADAVSGAYIPAADMSASRTNTKVVLCTEHSMGADGKCEKCGFACAHESFDESGKCTVCGYICQHPTAENEATDPACSACGAKLVAKAVGADGSTVYYADINKALTTAPDGSTLTVIAKAGSVDVGTSSGELELAENVTGITLDLNGHSLTGRAVKVGGQRMSGCKLTVIDSKGGGQIGISVYGNGTLLFAPESVFTTLTQLNVYDGTVELRGGNIAGNGWSLFNGIKLADLIPAGYAYRTYYGLGSFGFWVPLTDAQSNSSTLKRYALAIQACPHTKLSADFNDTSCPYCGTELAAVVVKDNSATGYADAQAAANGANGGTVKLLKNAGDVAVSSAMLLDGNGYTVAKLTVSGVTLESLLPEGYAYKSGTAWIVDLDGKTVLTNVTTAEAPIKSVTAQKKTVTVTYGETLSLKADIVWADYVSAPFTFRWYIDNWQRGENLISSLRSTFELTPTIDVGTRTVRMEFEKDGYIKSCEITVTVNPADAGVSYAPRANTLTYTGAAQELITKGETNDGTLVYSLTENGEYTETIPTGTAAGEYSVWYKVKGNKNHNDSTPTEIKVTIAQFKLSAPLYDSIVKSYDGTDALPTGNILSSGENFAAAAGMATDRVSLTPGVDFTVSGTYASALAGTDTVKLTVKLLNENYVFGDGTDSKHFTLTSDLIRIEKSTDIPDCQDGELTVTNRLEKTYEVDLAALIPTLTDPCRYGSISYSDLTVSLTDGYYTSGAEIVNGKLKLPIDRNITDDEGAIGTVKVTVTTDNYYDLVLTVAVHARNKTVPTGTPTLDKTAITYGEAVGSITLSGAMQDGEKTVEGTFSWNYPTVKPDAGSYRAEWTFTPNNTEEYVATTGVTEITVNKAEQSGVVIMSDYVYGGTIGTPSLTGKVGDGTVSYYYYNTNGTSNMAEWKDMTATTLNAGIYYLYAEIAESDNYMAFITADVPFEVKQATPVIVGVFVPDAVYGQTLGELTLENAAGNTPGTWSWNAPETVIDGVGDKDYTATFTPEDTVNYLTVRNVTITVAVAKAKIDLSGVRWTTPAAFDYDGSAHKVELTGLPAAVTGVTYTDNEKTYVGSYKAIAALAYDTENYELLGTVSDCEWRINAVEDPAAIAGTATVVLGGNKVDLSANVTGAKGNVRYAVTGALQGCTVNETTGEFISGNTAGTCTVTVTVAEKDVNGDGTAEYTGKVKTITVTVTDKRNAGVHYTGGAVPTEKTYGDADFTLTAQATDAGENGRWTWSSSDPTVLSVTGTGATATVKVLKSGVATVTVRYESGTTLGQCDAAISVAKRQLSVKANDKSMFVNGRLPDFDVTCEGFVNGDTAETVFESLPVASTTADGREIGSYDIAVTTPTFKPGMAEKYEIGTLEGGVLTVSRQPYDLYTIETTSGANGSISPSGKVSVCEDCDQTFVFTPHSGYTVVNVKVDGRSIGAVSSYTFRNVRENHTIEVIFGRGIANPGTGAAEYDMTADDAGSPAGGLCALAVLLCAAACGFAAKRKNEF